jgi:carbon-monoxide dehydrogenase medium subunit
MQYTTCRSRNELDGCHDAPHHAAPEGSVKAAPFSYFSPDSVDEVVSLLAEHSDEAKILAGGQSLMPLMALRVAAPEVLIDINRVRELDTVDLRSDRLQVGALTRHRAVERLPKITDYCSMIGDAVPVIGHVAIRNRGTVVGSLAHSDPAAEWPALAVALDAHITARGPSGSRRIEAESFFDSYLTNALADDEFATAVDFALPGGRVGSAFLELARRHGDFAIVGVGAVLRLAQAGAIDDARLVVSGAGPTPVRIRDAERMLIGESPSTSLFREAAEVVHGFVDPHGDIHGSAGYRRELTRVVARRALERASQRVPEAQEA